MVTNNQMIGSAMRMKEFEGQKPYRPPNEYAEKDIATKYDMSFLYSRESERIGEGVPLSDNKVRAEGGLEQRGGWREGRLERRNAEAKICLIKATATSRPLAPRHLKAPSFLWTRFARPLCSPYN